MIQTLVKSAYQTGCLSVASEAAISQFLQYRAYQASDLDALRRLRFAIEAGQIEREAPRQFVLFPLLKTQPISVIASR